MKKFFIVLSVLYSTIIYGANEIWLQDSDCKMLSGDGYSVKAIEGSLISYICTRENIVITCSTTTNTGTMFNNKPSAIVSFKELVLDANFVFWKGDSFEATALLNLKEKRYLISSTYFIEGKLINKYCVGEIKNFYLPP